MNSQAIRDAKNFYCGYLNSLISEYERVRDLNGKRIKDTIMNVINLLCKDFGDFSEIIKRSALIYEIMNLMKKLKIIIQLILPN